MLKTKLVIALGLILLWKCTAEEPVQTIQYEFINLQTQPFSIYYLYICRNCIQKPYLGD